MKLSVILTVMKILTFSSMLHKKKWFLSSVFTFSSVFREDNVWSHKLRAKMLIKTSEVVSVGHHM